MDQPLSELPLDALWKRFPIVLTLPQSCWRGHYIEESAALKRILPATARVRHIGSTAIGTIWAKPIIDILVECTRDCGMADIKELLTENGYLCMSQGPKRLSFNKGYTENGLAEAVFHLHLRYIGDNDELYFRDFLIEHPDIARKYEALKLRLRKQFEHDRDGYTNAKTAFVRQYTADAKRKYGDRYGAPTQ